jgi:hypothetical protein
MMTHSTEQQAQTLMERDALYPSQPKPDTLTNDQIVPSENSTGLESFVQQSDKTAEELIVDGISLELSQFEAWLGYRVKNEVLRQIFDKEIPEGEIDITAVASIVKNEVETERDRRFQSSMELENDTIPTAALRQLPDEKSPTSYWRKDVANLEVRSGIDSGLSSLLDTIADTGEDGLRDLSEVLIAEVHNEARDEAIRILVQQERDLRQQHDRDQEQIQSLREKVVTLHNELQSAKQDIQDRDLELLNQEVETHLRSEQSLAA